MSTNIYIFFSLEKWEQFSLYSRLFVCLLLVILFVAFQQQQTAKVQSALWWTVIAWLKSVFPPSLYFLNVYLLDVINPVV